MYNVYDPSSANWTNSDANAKDAVSDHVRMIRYTIMHHDRLHRVPYLSSNYPPQYTFTPLPSTWALIMSTRKQDPAVFIALCVRLLAGSNLRHVVKKALAIGTSTIKE